MLRRFLIALQFMTVFRVRGDLGETAEDMAAAVGWFPLVGLVLGGLLAGLSALLDGMFSAPVRAFLLVLALAAFTRGLHLDGLSDTADGLLSHRDRERRLAIMKDSRVGTFGVLALIFIVGLKTLLLAETVGPGAWRAALLFPVLGRWAASLTAGLSSYARPEGGLGRSFVDLAGKRELAGAAVLALVSSVLILGAAGLVAALAVGLTAVAGVQVWRRQIGGATGDILGATVELGETVGLLVIVAMA